MLEKSFWQVLVLFLLSLLIIICLVGAMSGCTGIGFEKKATLMPDSFGISVGQYDNENCPDNWPTGWNGVTINATWNLK